jgi:hypothetical protein
MIKISCTKVIQKYTTKRPNNDKNTTMANIKNSPKYFTCGEKHEIWHTYLSHNTVSKIIIGHRDFRHFQDCYRTVFAIYSFINSQVEIDIFQV